MLINRLKMIKEIKKSEIKKILCIKPRGIGDIILSTIILDNLHSFFPSAEIDYLTEEFAKDSVSTHPLVSRVLSYNKEDSILAIVKKVRKQKYDLVFDLWTNPRTAQITFLSGAKYRVGYSYRGRKYAYNIKANVGRGDYHSAEHNLELLKVLDIPIISKKIFYLIDNESKEFANQFISKLVSSKYLIGIIPSGGWDSKRCTTQKWNEILAAVKSQCDCKFLILWGPEDYQDAKSITTKNEQFTYLAPETNLKQLAALISKCNLIIANDSGPMHLAAAIGIPTLGLFGPTDPKKHGPYSEKSDYVIKSDLHCIICNKLFCPYNKECFNEMDVSEVVNKSLMLLKMNDEKN